MPPMASRNSEEMTYATRLNRSAKSRRSRTELLGIYEDYYRGNFFRRFDYRWGWSVPDGEMPDMFNPNYIQFIADNAVAALTQQAIEPVVNAQPFNSTTAQMAAITQTVVRKFYRDAGGHEFYDTIAAQTYTQGDVFYRAVFDPHMEDTLILSADELEMMQRMPDFPNMAPSFVSQYDERRFLVTMRAGGIRMQRINATQVFVPDGVMDLETAPWFAIVHVMPVVNAEEMLRDVPNAKLDQIRAQAVTNRRSPLNSANNSFSGGYAFAYDNLPNSQESVYYTAEDQGLCVIHEEWVRDGAEWSVRYYAGTDSPKLIGKVEPVRVFPFVHFHMNRSPNYFWACAPVGNLIKGQIAISKLRTHRLLTFLDSPGDMLIGPKGLEIDNLTTAKSIQIVYYSGAVAPQVVRFENSQTRFMAEFEQAIFQEMLMLGRVNALQMGQIPDRASQNALAMMNNISTSPMQRPERMIQNGIARLLEKAVRVFRDSGPLATFPRIALGISPGSERLAEEWSNESLALPLSVTMEKRVPLPTSSDARYDMGMRLLQGGLFAPENDPALRRFRQFVSGEDSILFQSHFEEMSIHEAEAENRLILSGVVQLIPDAETLTPAGNNTIGAEVRMVALNTRTGEKLFKTTQDHLIHIDRHHRKLADPNLSPGVRQVLEQHMIGEHEAIVAEREKQREQQELERQGKLAIMQSLGQGMVTDIANSGGKPENKNGQGTIGGGNMFAGV